MRSLFVFLLFILLLIFSNKCHAQLGLFKYGTFYTGIGLNNSINEANTYSIQDNILTETSVDNKYNYRFSVGFRRLARLSFESKGKSYIDGSETKWGLFRSGLLNGLEYNLNYEKIRDRGLTFENYSYWIRSLHKSFLIKLESTNLGGIDLKYNQLDLRLKKDIKSFRFSIGMAHRVHNAYGVDPFSRDFSDDEEWEEIAQELGYYNEFYFIDLNNNNHLDRLEQSFFRWYFEGEEVASNTDEFFKYHYSGIINRYNREEINILGNQHTLSNIMGGSFYKYNATHHTLLWCNVLPYHIALTDYGYDGGLDFEIGALIQKELTKNLAFYLEAVYLSYFKRKNYNIKTGLNYIIK